MAPKLGWLVLTLALCGASETKAESPVPNPPSRSAYSVATISPEKRAHIEEMLSLMGITSRLDEANRYAQEDLRSYARREAALIGEVPPDRKAELDRLAEAYVKELDAIAPRISWDGVSPLIIQYCVENYSDKEIEAIVAFYKSPPGAKLRTNRESLETVTQAAVRDFQATIVPTTLQATERLRAQAEAMRSSATR